MMKIMVLRRNLKKQLLANSRYSVAFRVWKILQAYAETKNEKKAK
jgi:hypothetical protein